ncbi:MAG TPA: hypothetical protein VFZ61_29990 [Polyangiales bacterium]
MTHSASATAPDPTQLTARLVAEYPPRAHWRLSVDVVASPATVNVRLLDGNHAYLIAVTYVEGGARGADAWEQMSAASALYGLLLDAQLDAQGLPCGEGVSFAGARFDIQVEQRWVPTAS